MGQRVTNGMMINSFNRNLGLNSARMDRYQSQLATNRKIVRISDDPVGVIKSINARTKLNDIEQFDRNVSDARAWMTATETAVSEVNEILKRAYELSVQAATETLAPEDQKAISHEIKQLKDHLVQVGNTTLGDKFVFGGHNVSNQPFFVDEDKNIWLDGSGEEMLDMVNEDPDAFVVANQPANYEIGFSLYMDIGVGGATFMGLGEENLYNIFSQMENTLNGLDPTDASSKLDNAPGNPVLQPFMGRFQEAQRKMLATLADLGGRQNRLDLISDRYSQDTINYTQMKSDVEDLDQAEAIMHFSMQEAVYRAALSVGGKIIQPTLVDFLR